MPELTPIILQFVMGFAVLIPFFIIWAISKFFFRKAIRKSRSKRHIIAFLSRMVNLTIIAIGLITMLGTWGVNVSALIAGLGLTGFAFGFALKDVLSSIIAGVLVIFYRPFKLNSRINVMGVEGEVIDIDMRYTTLEHEGHRHLIPNSKLLSEKVTVLDDGK